MTSIGVRVALAAMMVAAGGSAGADDVSGEQLVDALNGVFGNHAHTRGSHAKGQCVKGAFTPTPEAAGLSKAPMFAATVPILGRFSFGGGNPKAGEKAKSPRGLAMRFDPDGKSPMDFVQLSAPIFFASTPEQALAFLLVRAPGPDGKPDADKVKAFTEANPNTGKQGAYVASKPIPASYAGLNYWGIHAFIAENAKGEKSTIKFKSIPLAGELGLSEDEAKAKADDFFTADLAERVGKGPVGFDLMAIVGEKGDPTNDPSVEWPEAERKQIKLGKIEITALEDNATCDATTFDPNNLAAGLSGAPDDKVLPARATSYAVSLSRRAAP
ncbi:MAG: catalase family peroxidase [Hyphomicrobium sp.]